MNREFAHLPAGSAGAAPFVHLIGKRIALLVHYRFLIYNLIVRDLKTRYRNSVLGFLWSLLNPLGMMLVFTIISPLLFRDQTIVNYPVFLLSGILPWNFFSASIMTGTNSVVASGHLIKKVYFPPEVLPIATILANLVNFLLALLVLFALIFIFGIPLTPWIWLLPVVILIQTTFTLGIVFFLSTLQVYYHDTLLIMDVVMLAWFFLTPVFYSASMLPTTYEVFGVTLNVQRLMYILNPMASLINMHR
ncbi:ABC transporter permease, partial [Caldilinea sp.]|uniref:ABC transporter permease n=1 Tax=Caldilinea sp. TaxID=2293560 RepID=UPI001B09A117